MDIRYISIFYLKKKTVRKVQEFLNFSNSFCFFLNFSNSFCLFLNFSNSFCFFLNFSNSFFFQIKNNDLEALKNFLFILDKQAMFDKTYIYPIIWVWIYGCGYMAVYFSSKSEFIPTLLSFFQ